MPYVMRLPTLTGGDGGSGGGGSPTALFLNHWNGADDGTTFTDEVPGVSWTIVSGASANTDTSAPHFGSAALEFTTGCQVRSDGFTGPDAFTLEGFCRPDSGAVGGLGLSSSTTGAQIGANIDETNNTVQLFVLNAAGSVIYNQVASIAISASVYKHLALAYDSAADTVTGYFDGDQYLHATSIDTTGYNLDRGDVGFTTGGFWDETRLVGSAIYSGATLTIPTSEFSP